MPTNLAGEAQIETITSFTYFIFAIIILVHHTVSLYKTNGKKAFNWSYLKGHPTLLFAYALFISGFFLGGNMVIGTVVGFTSTTWCPVQAYFGAAFYMIFKLFLYLVLVSRTWQTFNLAGNGLQYESKPLIIYSSILVIWTIGNIIGNVFTITYLENDSYPRCIAHPHRGVIISMSLLDFISGIANMILFIKPFIKLSKMADIKDSVRNVAVKQTVLAMIALVTTLMTLIAFATIGSPKIFSAFDAVVSTLCIALMHKWHFGCVSSMLYCCMRHGMDKHVRNMAKVTDNHHDAMDTDSAPKTSSMAEETHTVGTETETALKPIGDDHVTVTITNENGKVAA
eukprot:37062_1